MKLDTPTLHLKRKKLKICPDPSRVLLRPFIPKDSQHTIHIIGRALALTAAEVDALLTDVFAEFNERHIDPKKFSSVIMTR